MKTAIVGAGLITVMVLVPALSHAQDAKAQVQAPAAVEASAAAAVAAPAAEAVVADQTKPVEVGNKICPVSGEKIDGSMGEIVKMEHNGKMYSLCCGMCVKDFNKDPEKYTAIADKEVSTTQ